MPEKDNQVDALKTDFLNFRSPEYGERFIHERIDPLLADETYQKGWEELSFEEANGYPDQGLLQTEYDHLDNLGVKRLPPEIIRKTLELRLYFLHMFNHPYRIQNLDLAESASFAVPPEIGGKAFEKAVEEGTSLSIGDLGATVVGSDHERQSRTERYAEGPFVKLGKHARTVFVGSDSPDVWNSSEAIATMAASLSLATISRNGIMANVKRQADLAEKTFKKLSEMRDFILDGRSDKDKVYAYWRNNVGAVLEPNFEKAAFRLEALYKKGVRTFSVYSPEPGSEIVATTNKLRNAFGNEIEIIAGRVVDIEQAKRLEEVGADAIVVGIGGGGRCITGVRSGSVVDWPMLIWNLRGKIGIPVIADGGASDHVAETLLLGASGIQTSRVVAGGTIESPGGFLYYVNKEGIPFKPYGGEASARTKILEGKMLPLGIPSFVEGKTSEARISYIEHALPTLTDNLHNKTEEAILAMVFRNAKNLHALHSINPSPLRRVSQQDILQRQTH